MMLCGLVLLWLGIDEAHPSGAVVYDQRRSRAERWLSIISSMLMGLGAVGIGLIAVRYPPDSGGIPASATLVDLALWVVSPVCLIVGYLVSVGLKVRRTPERKRARRGLADEL
jgi:hypothetical protein